MSPKRGDRMAAPPVADEWDIRFGNNPAASGWEELCRAVAGNTRRCFEDLRSSPTPKPETSRHHRLRHEYKEVRFGGKVLPQWQYEVTGGGRVWYLVDDHKRVIWIWHAGTGHPKETD